MSNYAAIETTEIIPRIKFLEFSLGHGQYQANQAMLCPLSPSHVKGFSRIYVLLHLPLVLCLTDL